MNDDINDIGRIRALIDAVLAELPGEEELQQLPVQADLQGLARRLEEAHEVLVAALESVEKG